MKNALTKQKICQIVVLPMIRKSNNFIWNMGKIKIKVNHCVCDLSPKDTMPRL